MEPMDDMLEKEELDFTPLIDEDKEDLEIYAYIPSAEEYDFYFKKFRAFMGAKLSEKAKKRWCIFK